MTIHLLCLGTLKENYLKDAQRDLVASLVRKNGINSCQIIEFNEEPLNEQASQGQIQSAWRWRRLEFGRRFLKMRALFA